MNRVIVLLDMAKDLMTQYKEDSLKYEEWKIANPEKYRWQYYGEFRATPTQVKRLLLVLRQETIRFEKSLPKKEW